MSPGVLALALSFDADVPAAWERLVAWFGVLDSLNESDNRSGSCARRLGGAGVVDDDWSWVCAAYGLL